MINLILLAAGRSARFGENKLLYAIEGIPMYRRMLSNALNFQRECLRPVRVILVTAYDEIERYAVGKEGFCAMPEKAAPQETNGSAKADSTGRNYYHPERLLVRNDNQAAGLSYSIALGLGAARAEAEKGDCFMFAVCDQPFMRWELLADLADGYYRSGKGIACMAYGEKRGNPVVFGAKYKAALLALTGDEGGRNVIRAHEDDLFLCRISERRPLKDMDRKEDL